MDDRNALSPTPRERRWLHRVFAATGLALFVVATILQVTLERKAFVWGPLSTFGMTPFTYLASIWCMAMAALIVLSHGVGTFTRVLGLVGQFVVVAFLVVATFILGAFTHNAVTAPLYRATSPDGDTEYLLRVGDAAEPNRLGIYRAEGWHFHLIDASVTVPDTRRFADVFRIKRSAEGKLLLVYPGRDGNAAQVELPE